MARATKTARRQRQPEAPRRQYTAYTELEGQEIPVFGAQAVGLANNNNDPSRRGCTPPFMTPTYSHSHSRQKIHPYVEQDLRSAEIVPLHSWVEAILKLPEDQLNDWSLKIGQLRWFEDEIIQNALIGYCRADSEIQRYEPFTTLSNRVLELARGKLPGIPKLRSYPIDGVGFVDNANSAIETIPEHGQLAAIRRPDILCLPGGALQNHTQGNRVAWTDILHWWELKYRLKLIDKLDAERSSRGMSPLDPLSGLPVAVQKSQSKIKGKSRRKGQGRASKKRTRVPRPPKPPDDTPPPEPRDHIPGLIKVGTKRLPEDDLLEGIDLRDSSKTRDKNTRRHYLWLGKDAAVQSGSYALELLSCTYGTRVSCFSAVLKDDELLLWFYDASGIVYTKQYLSLVHDFEKTAAIIVALAHCTPEQLGAIPPSVMKPPVPYPRSFPPPNLTNNILRIPHPCSGRQVRVKLKEPLFTQYILTGRRTFTYAIEATPKMTSTGLIAKFAYQVNTRVPEQNLVTIARKAGVKHLPEVHMWADLWKLSDGIRRTFMETEEGPAEYEDRTLRMIVYTRYASVRTLFAERCELIPVMVEQMVNCLHNLRYKANILHRDVSIDNIMFQMRGDQYWFVLIDFDMAVVLPEEGSSYIASSKSRTGTLPFMACELIRDAWSSTQSKDWQPIHHRLRHDFESLFWVSLWCVLVLLGSTTTEHQKQSLLGRAKFWEIGDLESIATRKEALCTEPFEYTKIQLPAPAQCLEAWFAGWRKVFRKSIGALKERREAASISKSRNTPLEPFDDETAGGTITRDILNGILTPLMPFRQSDLADDRSVEKDADLDEGVAVEVEGRQVKNRVIPGLQLAKPRSHSRKKVSPEVAEAVRARILSRLRPRRKAL